MDNILVFVVVAVLIAIIVKLVHSLILKTTQNSAAGFKLRQRN